MYSKRTYSIDSLQSPQLGHSWYPPTLSMPTHILKKPMGTRTTLKHYLEGAPFIYSKCFSNPISVSISYKLAIWIYIVRPYQTPLPSLLSRAFLISFAQELVLGTQSFPFKFHLDKPRFLG